MLSRFDCPLVTSPKESDAGVALKIGTQSGPVPFPVTGILSFPLPALWKKLMYADLGPPMMGENVTATLKLPAGCMVPFFGFTVKYELLEVMFVIFSGALPVFCDQHV